MNICMEIEKAMKGVASCKVNGQDAIVTTHCLYPSFEAVTVYIHKTREGFRVHDDGNAFASSWLHGRDSRQISHEIDKVASQYHLKVKFNELYVEVINVEWLYSAVLAVANGSAHAANNSVNKHVAVTEKSLRDNIGNVLNKPSFKAFSVKSEVELVGGSGNSYRFDFVIDKPNTPISLLIDVITPHHASISHKYTAFSDIISGGLPRGNNFAIFERELRSNDSTLMSQVADLVPFSSFQEGALRTLN